MAEELTGLGAQAPVGGGESSVVAPVGTSTETEKMIPQSHANELIGQKKIEAHQKGRAEGRAEALAELNLPTQNANQASGQAVGNTQQPQKTVEQIVEEKLAEKNYRDAHQHAMSGFVQKMENGPKKYADFEEKVSQLNLPSIMPIVHLANAVDNSEDVVYDLANNPEKVSRLFDDLQRTPQVALMKIKQLSASIKANQAAAKQVTPDEPLSQIKPSSISTGNGSASINALRSKDYLRG